MKINLFSTLWVIIFGLITALLSAGFYSVERELLLNTLADGVNRSLYRLEEDVQKAMQNGRQEELQAILDRTPAINNTIAEVSVAKNGQRIFASSSRSLQGKAIGDEFAPLSELNESLINNSHSAFVSDFYFYQGPVKHDIQLLVRLNKEYVFGRLNQIALAYSVIISLVIGLLSLLMFVAIRRLLVHPLENVTEHARSAQLTHSPHYFIRELAQLDHTLSNSFQTLHRQKLDLQNALDESVYLDGILRTVADINQLLISAQTVEELMAKSTLRLAQHSGYALCWLGLSDTNNIVLTASSSDAEGQLHIGMNLASVANLGQQDAVNEALVHSKSIVLTHLEQHEQRHIWQAVAQNKGYGSFIALPLLPSIHEQPIGVLGLYALRPDGFADKEIAMLEELAGDISFAIRSFNQRMQLEKHLTTDAITDLPNRVALVDTLTLNSNVTLAIINIDRFSDINDVYGINTGDGLLAIYGQWLKQRLTPQTGVTLYKIGGDEYVLLFSESLAVEHCKKFLEQLILNSAKESFMINGIEVVLTITIGVATASERILEHATAALKQAKGSRQSLQFFVNSTAQRQQESNIAWYKRLKTAIEESRIVPYFHPIVDNQTQRIIKYEALMRLIENDGTVVSPMAFLPVAKKTRLYSKLTQIMLEKTCEILKHSPVPISINLSTEDLLNQELADMIEKLVVENHLGQKIIFEILESEGIANYAEVSTFVDRFKSLGCSFAIDDFGSGYSNFDHLLKLNVDTIKIDGSLIKNIVHDRNARIFVQHIRDFAHEMGMTTVAEYVASPDIYRVVQELGIDASQGYYFYEPAAFLAGQPASKN